MIAMNQELFNQMAVEGTEPVLVRCCLMHCVQAATGSFCRPLPQALGGKSPAEVTPHGVGRCHKVAEGTGLLDLRWFAG